MRMYKLVLVCAFCLALSGQGHAADIGEIVGNVQRVYAEMNSFTADFTQELIHQSGSTEVRQGKLIFMKPMLVRWETISPYPELLLVTDKEIWNHLPDERLAYRYSLELVRDQQALIVVVTGQSPLDQEFEIEPLPDEEGLLHLLLYPRQPSQQLTEAQIWLDPRTWQIKKASVIDFFGNTNRVTFTSFTANGQAVPDDFAFVPPAGTEVEDHAENGGAISVPLTQ